MKGIIIVTLTLVAFFANFKCLVGSREGERGNGGSVVNMYASGDTSKESWAYVTVRPKAHMFYWLYRTTHQSGYLKRPLIMWLQGGPGGSSTGFGNFEELGPLDTNLKPRNTTWLQTASLLFVDNPVGTGYSYVEDESAYTTNIDEISVDLLTMIKAFMNSHSQFQKIPFYIFSESYGGKMAAAFSNVLYNAIEKGELKMDFKGFAMGDSWISPVDIVLSWGPYLLANSIVSQNGFEDINKGAKKCESLVSQGKYYQATVAWSNLEDIVKKVGSGVNFYNIRDFGNSLHLHNATKSPLEHLYDHHVKVMLGEDLSALMNGPIRKKLKIIPKNVTWGAQAGRVFGKQSKDFMKDVVSTVNNLINGRKLKVIIYSGQLDLICDVLGTVAWFSKTDESEIFKRVPKQQFSCGAHKPVCYFGSSDQNVQFYWILDAGHMVPADNGDAALSMVEQIIA